jgi:hypothetical protein
MKNLSGDGKKPGEEDGGFEFQGIPQRQVLIFPD